MLEAPTCLLVNFVRASRSVTGAPVGPRPPPAGLTGRLVEPDQYRHATSRLVETILHHRSTSRLVASTSACGRPVDWSKAPLPTRHQLELPMRPPGLTPRAAPAVFLPRARLNPGVHDLRHGKNNRAPHVERSRPGQPYARTACVLFRFHRYHCSYGASARAHVGTGVARCAVPRSNGDVDRRASQQCTARRCHPTSGVDPSIGRGG